MKLSYISAAVPIHYAASLVIVPSFAFLALDTAVGQWATNLALLKRGLLDDAQQRYTVSACLSLASALVGV